MFTEKLQNDLISIINHFGTDSQMFKLYEEIGELIESIDPENEKEEMVDVWIILTQFLLIDEKMQEILRHKINRTLDRIKTGYYNQLNLFKGK